MHIQRFLNRKNLIAGLVIGLMVVGGVIILATSHAATPYSSVEAETGSIKSPAGASSDSTASGAKAVQFKAATITPPAPTPPLASGGFPTAVTTGVPAGTKLTVVSGNYDVPAGQTVSGLDVRGKVTIGSGGTLKSSRVRCFGEDTMCVEMTTRSTVMDTEIGGGDAGTTMSYAYGIYTGVKNDADRNLILRVNIHNTSRGVQLDGQTTVRDSYMHDFPYDCGYHNTDPVNGRKECAMHTSNAFMSKGQGNKVIHNTLQQGTTAVLFAQVYDEDGSFLSDVLIDNNRIRSLREPNGYTPSYAVNIENKHIVNPASIRITNNTTDAGPFDAGQYFNAGYTISGNKTVPAGSAINP